MRASASLLCLLFGAALVTTACSGGGTEPSRPTPGLHFIAGNAASDTIDTMLPQALVVEVRDQNGETVSGVVVRFESMVTTPSGGSPTYETLVGRLDQPTPTAFAYDTTDAKGQAKAIVQLGSLAGVARTAVMAPVYGFVDTATFTVRPGNATHLGLKVRDTLAVIGAAYSLGSAVSDRHGNPRPSEVLTYVPTPNVVSVDAAGNVKALTGGRAAIAIRAGTFIDTSWVTVVPDLTLAVVAWRTTGRFVSTVKLDGSQLKPLSAISSTVVMPRWNVAGTRITFYEGDPGSNSQVYTVDLQGSRSPFMTPPPTDPRSEFFPRYSADGEWMYFSGTSSTTYAYSVWRAHVDGTGAELVASAPSASYYQASPSRDGTRVAFNAAGMISTIDLATRTITSLNVRGDFPEYSPDGTKILFIAGSGYIGQLAVMNADGSNVRMLADHNYDIYSSPSWSPDGKWIVLGGPAFYNGVTLDLVNAITFEVIPLTTLRGVEQAAIKP
jgi:hypothetical protein